MNMGIEPQLDTPHLVFYFTKHALKESIDCKVLVYVLEFG
jgi:hypothetical protein